MNDRYPEGLSRIERGKGAQTPPPRPAPPSPLSRRNNKKIDGCRSLQHDKNSPASLRSEGDRHHSES
jgi:hypothetical protein